MPALLEISLKRRSNAARKGRPDGRPRGLFTCLVGVFVFFAALVPLRAQDVDALLEAYLAGHWKANPGGAATPAGIHAYDRQLEDFSPAAIDQEIQRNRASLQAFQRLDAASLPVSKRVDLAVAVDHINLTLLELEQVREWKRNPQLYVSSLGDSVLALVKREFAPAEPRFAAVAARLKLLPKVLQQARVNLNNPPELFTRKAIEMIPDTADFLQDQVPQAASEQGASKKLQRRVSQEAARAAAALRQFGAWLQSGLLPRSKGSPALGAELYKQKFRYYLDSAFSPEEVLAAAERDLRTTQDEMRRLAPVIAPDKSLPELLAQLSGAHPEPENVLAAFRTSVNEAKQFVGEKQLVTLPYPDRLQVLKAPPFYAFEAAFLDPPGPFEPDLPSFYYVSSLDRFSAEQAEAVLRRGNNWVIPIIATREAYPGHYPQLDAMNRSPWLARKVFANRAFIDGWSHYSEQVMFEQGFHSDPRARLFQLRSALDAQLDAIVDSRLHAGQITPAEAIKLGMEEGFDERAAAEDRVERAYLSPVELTAAYIGKLEILRLREEMKKKQGPAFALKEFHDRLLALGAPPVRYARDLLLAETP